MIEIRNLTVAAPNGLALLQNIDLVVGAGERHAFVGASGAGKTTLALAAIGALPRQLTATGSVQLFGYRLDGLSAARRSRVRRGRVAMLGQDPAAELTPTRTVAAALTEFASGSDPARALREVGLPPTDGMLSRYPWELSGGQQRRLALARALSGDPELLILDEPTAGLDTEAKRQVVELVDQVVGSRGLTLIVLSHDHEVVQELTEVASRVAAGRLGPDGGDTPVPVLRRPDGITAGGPVVLELSNLTAHVGSRPRRRILNGFDLDLRLGSMTAVIGPSGSGKTTLARAMVGLGQVDSGVLRLNGEQIPLALRSRTRRHRRLIQLAPQDPVGALGPHRCIGASILRAARLPKRQQGDVVSDALEEVGLDPAMSQRYPHMLSGGQRQRALLARALVTNPRVLICDETTANLDHRTRGHILELLRARAQTGTAIMLLTHDSAVVEACDRTIRVGP